MKRFVLALSLILVGSIVSPLTLAGEGKAQVITAQLLEDIQLSQPKTADPARLQNSTDLLADTNMPLEPMVKPKTAPAHVLAE